MTSPASGHTHDPAHHHVPSSSGKAAPESATDPVCGMTVKPESTFQSEWEGATYRFCSNKCKTRFDAGPRAYLQPAKPAVTDSGTEYTDRKSVV